MILDLNKDWDGQTLQQLPDPDKIFVAWDWSPDGKKLIGTFTDGGVGYFSFETNRYERVSDVGTTPMWLPDSSRYVCLSGEQAYLGNISSKGIREIFSLRDDEIRGIAISKDAQLIYFSAFSSESDIWLLDLQ